MTAGHASHSTTSSMEPHARQKGLAASYSASARVTPISFNRKASNSDRWVRRAARSCQVAKVSRILEAVHPAPARERHKPQVPVVRCRADGDRAY